MITCGLLWTPFSARFGTVLEQMRYYKEVIRDEFGIYQAKVSRRMEEANELERLAAEKERKQSKEARDKLDGLAKQTEELKQALEKHQLSM